MYFRVTPKEKLEAANYECRLHKYYKPSRSGHGEQRSPGSWPLHDEAALSCLAFSDTSGEHKSNQELWMQHG